MENRRMNTIDGLPIVNGKKKIDIVITGNDVKRGANKNPASCAAALACLHDVKDCTQARVHVARTYLKIGKKWVRYYTPDSLRSEIISFDRGGGFAPGEYTLPVIVPSKRKYGQQGSKTNQTNPRRDRNKKKRRYHVTAGVRQFGANR